MNFALTEDHEFLRDVARTFVAKEVDLAPLLIPGATVADAGYAAHWTKIVEVGWPGLIVPEAYGGSGMSGIDLAMVAGEIGRALVPSPLLGTLAGTWAVLRGGSEEQKQRVLPGVAGGTTALALAISDARGNCDGPGSDATAVHGATAVRGADAAAGLGADAAAERGADGFSISGVSSFVVDAASADTLVVAAVDGDGVRRLFLVDAHGPGVGIEVLPWRDITRQVCDVRFAGAAAEPLAEVAAEVWPWVRDRLLAVLAAENAAGIEWVLDATVAYAKERVAFGRPIGAYQSIKHALADTFGARECANAAALYAAWALSSPEAPNASLAAAMAHSYTSDAYVAATHQSIQIFGALGFSWEMKNHLYFKRARANATIFGSPAFHRSRVIDLLAAEAA